MMISMKSTGRDGCHSSLGVYALSGACGCLLVALASPAAFADEVYGQVKIGGRLTRGGTLEFRRPGSPSGSVAVGIGQDGSYRVFLEPGRYEARIKLPEATRPLRVTSLPAPIRQDLVFP
jgi:hypothetical protein